MWEDYRAYIIGVIVMAGIAGVIGFAVMVAKFYQKAGPEEAIVRSGKGGLYAVTGNGMLVIPIIHRAERMDLSVKRIEVSRRGEGGLICKDNIRADIEVAFFVRVNSEGDAITSVAQALGCRRASEQQALIELFDAKFSEALKTVGKQFDFVEMYTERDKFKMEILNVIGTDLNGYVLDDCAIDFLEQTPLEKLNPQNVLDAEGIKKITDLTAKEHIVSNDITREKEKTIKKQDVEAREAILALERQQVEAEEKQRREIAEIAAREQAQAAKVREEERLRAEAARIQTEEEIHVAEENKDRQIIVARKNKERTDAVETERVEKDRALEATDRERVVGVAQVEKEKAIEVEQRNIQEVIRERVVVERAVVEEQERIKDTEAFATADRAEASLDHGRRRVRPAGVGQAGESRRCRQTGRGAESQEGGHRGGSRPSGIREEHASDQDVGGSQDGRRSRYRPGTGSGDGSQSDGHGKDGYGRSQRDPEKAGRRSQGRRGQGGRGRKEGYCRGQRAADEVRQRGQGYRREGRSHEAVRRRRPRARRIQDSARKGQRDRNCRHPGHRPISLRLSRTWLAKRSRVLTSTSSVARPSSSIAC